MEFTLTLAMVMLFVLLWHWFRRPPRLSELGDKFPGPPALPIVGNGLQLGTNTSDLFYNFEKLAKKFHGSPLRLWIGNQLFLLISSPKDLEILMGSNKLIDKAATYNFLHAWLGTGLLTSTGTKWRHHRKILTPTFHFKILEQFVGIFFANGETLIECLQDKVDGPGFDIHHFITLNTLDNICESAMGMKINAQKNSDSEYVKAVRDLSDLVMERSFKLWLQNDLIFKVLGLKTKQDKALSILHGTTERVIKSRREEIAKEQAANGGSTQTANGGSTQTANGGSTQTAEDGTKRRLAFLDLLIQSTNEGSQLTDENIREEVDTFMFEGHDTTAAGITYTLWLLAWHQDIQDAVYQELQQVWPDGSECPTYHQLQELKVLERVIKETLRLYPSVPFMGREFTEDTVLSGGLVAPKGATATLLAFMVHKDPEIFPEPEKFDPDRFLPENAQGRHPYAYIPFSAGPRNCIGQKFALLEMKCTLAQVLNKYKFSPASPTQELKLSADLILTAKEGVPVHIQPRRLVAMK